MNQNQSEKKLATKKRSEKGKRKKMSRASKRKETKSNSFELSVYIATEMRLSESCVEKSRIYMFISNCRDILANTVCCPGSHGMFSGNKRTELPDRPNFLQWEHKY